MARACPDAGTHCHCSRVTTSTAWPSSVTVLSTRVATGAMATCTGRLPWARLVTTVWYILTGIWTKPGEEVEQEQEGQEQEEQEPDKEEQDEEQVQEQ